MWPNESFPILLYFCILHQLQECLRFSVLQYNVILIDSTIYPGCWNSPLHLLDFDIFACGQSPFLPGHHWTVWLFCDPFISTSWLSRLCRGQRVEASHFTPPTHPVLFHVGHSFLPLVQCHTGKTAQCKRNNHSNIFTMQSGRHWLKLRKRFLPSFQTVLTWGLRQHDDSKHR